MWLFTTSGFVSIVAYGPDPALLLVRAHHADDIAALFGPEAVVVADAGHDYKFRAVISRERVAQVVAERVGEIMYTNFKAEVADPTRHQAYLGVWRTMKRFQVALYGPLRRPPSP